jgi:hypothetical protein
MYGVHRMKVGIVSWWLFQGLKVTAGNSCPKIVVHRINGNSCPVMVIYR